MQTQSRGLSQSESRNTYSREFLSRTQDVENFTRLIKLMEKIYRGKPPVNFFDEIEDVDVMTLFNDENLTGKGHPLYIFFSKRVLGIAKFATNLNLTLRLNNFKRFLFAKRQ